MPPFVTVSNEVPEQPVLSPVSHCVFERRLIEKYIAENGVDPINGQPLAEDDLIEIKSKWNPAYVLLLGRCALIVDDFFQRVLL